MCNVTSAWRMSLFWKSYLVFSIAFISSKQALLCSIKTYPIKTIIFSAVLCIFYFTNKPVKFSDFCKPWKLLDFLNTAVEKLIFSRLFVHFIHKFCCIELRVEKAK